MPSRAVIATVLVLLVLLHVYIGARLLPDLPIGALGRACGAVLLLASLVLIPLSMMAPQRRIGDGAVWAGMIAMGLFSSLFVLTLLRDISVGILGAFSVTDTYIDHGSAIAVVVLAVLASLLGYFNARRRARLVKVVIPIAGLPPALHGFTIAQITDIHVSSTVRKPDVEAIVDAVNALQPDLIAITGDLVDGSVARLREHTAPLARLRARHGAYFVTGNHEYYSGADAWTKEVARLGLRVLENEHVMLEHNGARLVIAGVTDYTAHHFDPSRRSDPARALHGAPDDAGVKILLAHQPRSAPAAAEAGFDLQLSGHTHGGQFWPWNHFVRLQQPYTAGLHRLQQLWVYTSRGTGYWGPPKRLGAPSEITRLTLVAAETR